MNELATDGRGVLLISSEMPELPGMCDRVYVMNEGELIGELDASDASQERIMSMIVKKAGFAVEFDVIAAVFIGEASMAGGVGKIVGASTCVRAAGKRC